VQLQKTIKPKNEDMNIKELFPPILIKFVKRAIGLEGSKEYESYSKALQVCTSDAYQNIELCNMIADKTLIHIDILKEKPFSLDPTDVFLLAAINQYLNVYSTKSLKILDFGGACGAHYFEIRRLLPDDVSLKWYVVETAQMVKSAIEKMLNSNELVFVSSIEDIKTEIDFIHSSSTLQYVHNPYEYIERLIKVNANWIFFNRMMFNENDRDFITVHRSFLASNGPGKLPKGYSDRIISYPHTTMSFRKFNSTIINNGYEIEWMFLETSGSYQIRKEKISGKGLLYVRK
jgi:putative methyltransferase (TIGR04325 family)